VVCQKIDLGDYGLIKNKKVELDDEKELREYRIGDGDPVYASNSIYITLCNKYIVA